MKKYYVGTLLSIALELIQINAYVIYNNNIAVSVHPCCTLFGFIKNTDVKLHTFFYIFMLVINHLAHIKNILVGLVLLEKLQLSSFLIAVCTCASDGLVNLVSHS